MSTKKIGIVTVLYNSEKVLFDFFETLNQQLFKDFVLYVVDNKSPDNSLSVAKKLAKDVFFETCFIENSQNDGIAKGNNLGINKAFEDGCEYILISNNDVVFYPDTISILYETSILRSEKVVAPKILIHADKSIWYGGGELRRFSFRTKHWGIGTKDIGQYDSMSYVTYTPTCVTLIHKTVFDSIGLMDENFFVYWDDTDFVYRVQKNKMKILYCPKACLEHKESVCTGKRSDFFYYQFYKNREYFINKHSKISFLLHFIDFVYLYSIMRIKMRNNLNQWEVIKKAMREGCKIK